MHSRVGLLPIHSRGSPQDWTKAPSEPLRVLGQALITPLAALVAPTLTAVALAGTALAPEMSPTISPGPPAATATAPDPTAPGSTPTAAWTPPVPGRIIKPFDRPQQTWLAGHRGIDLAAAVGEPVRAVASGVVVFAGMVAGRGVVSVQHGPVRSTYEPVEPAVTAGESVDVGEVLGQVGGSAHADCACLHLGARQGDDYLDPWWLLRRPSRLVSASREGPVSRPWPP